MKAHVSFGLASQIPEMVYITDAKTDDRKALSHLKTSYQSILVYDRGYLDFAFFKDRIDNNGDFVTRLKEKISYQVLEDRPVISGETQSSFLIRSSGSQGKRRALRAWALVKCGE